MGGVGVKKANKTSDGGHVKTEKGDKKKKDPGEPNPGGKKKRVGGNLRDRKKSKVATRSKKQLARKLKEVSCETVLAQTKEGFRRGPRRGNEYAKKKATSQGSSGYTFEQPFELHLKKTQPKKMRRKEAKGQNGQNDQTARGVVRRSVGRNSSQGNGKIVRALGKRSYRNTWGRNSG